MERAALIDLIVSTVKEYCASRGTDGPVTIDSATRLFGRSGVLDSLGLVSVVVDVEQKLRDDLRIDIALMDDRAMSRNSSPFGTPDSLADYILELLAERQKG
jgi:acyl carrier protein